MEMWCTCKHYGEHVNVSALLWKYKGNMRIIYIAHITTRIICNETQRNVHNSLTIPKEYSKLIKMSFNCIFYNLLFPNTPFVLQNEKSFTNNMAISDLYNVQPPQNETVQPSIATKSMPDLHTIQTPQMRCHHIILCVKSMYKPIAQET